MRGRNAMLMGWAALLVLGTAAGTTAWMGRAAREQAVLESSAEPLRTPMRETGARGGRFVIGVTNDARTFNPIMSNETSSSDVSDRLFTALTEFDNDAQMPYPVLATSWDVSPDGLTYTWHLRRGARFSDGHPITSEDVLFTFAVAYDSTLHQSIYDLLTFDGRKLQVSAPDSYTVVTRLPKRIALVVPKIGALRILPKHVLEAPWRAGRFASSYGVGTPPESLVTRLFSLFPVCW